MFVPNLYYNFLEIIITAVENAKTLNLDVEKNNVCAYRYWYICFKDFEYWFIGLKELKYTVINF